MQQFPDAHNLMITGGTFSQTQHLHGSGRDAGIHMLKQHIAADAIYDSAERFPPAQCHPGTRERIVATIMEWIDDPEPDKQTLWLHGPAGAGKSAVGHSIAMTLKEILGSRRYGSSFFFAKGAPGRGDGNKLFSTIAYELAINFPEYRAVLDAAIQDNPTLPTKSINIQLHNLLITPLRTVTNWPSHHPTVIIDGLDECSGGNRMQGAILSTIANAIIQHHIPLRFLIISRPEYWIADVFETGCFSSVVKCLSLRDDHEADAGIRRYLCDEFDRIYDENIEVMYSTPRPWPDKHVVDRFVILASGQFIYASTIIKFVGDSPHCNPLDQLHLLIRAGPHKASAFSEMDSLYAAILSSYPRWETLKRVLAAILLSCAYSEAIIEDIFGVSPEELRQILRSMRSLICKTELFCSPLLQRLEPTFGAPAYDQRWLSFHHLSFREFLTSPFRSGRFVVDYNTSILAAWCVLMRHLRGLLQGDPDIEQKIKRIGISQYRYCLRHLYSRVSRQHLEYPPLYGAETVIRQFQHLLGALDIVSQDNSHIPYANHTFLLLEMVKHDIEYYQETMMPRRKLFDKLLDLLKLALTISAQQVLLTINMDGPIFGYLVTERWVDHSERFSFEEISTETNVTDEAIVSELQNINGVVTLGTKNGYGYLEIIPHFFEHQVYTVPNDYLDTFRVLEWEAQARANVVSMFTDLGNNATYKEEYEYWRGIIKFLDNPPLSDIRLQQHIHDSDRMAILSVLIGPCFPHMGFAFTNYAVASLGWLTRQLTGPNRLVIESFDSRLIGEIEEAVKSKFSALLPLYKEASAHDSTLHNCGFSFEDLSTHLSAKPDGTYLWSKEKVCVFTYAIGGLFNRLTDILEIASENWHIVPANLYPHFSSFLLKTLSGIYYSILQPDFEGTFMITVSKIYQNLLWWMPHAIPTEDNLNMIRLTHYLWHKMDQKDQPIPPPRLCNLTMEFLMKYDPLMLPESELGHLNSWLVKLRDTERPTEDDSATDENGSDEDDYSMTYISDSGNHYGFGEIEIRERRIMIHSRTTGTTSQKLFNHIVVIVTESAAAYSSAVCFNAITTLIPAFNSVTSWFVEDMAPTVLIARIALTDTKTPSFHVSSLKFASK